jgi:hypothetical protein
VTSARAASAGVNLDDDLLCADVTATRAIATSAAPQMKIRDVLSIRRFCQKRPRRSICVSGIEAGFQFETAELKPGFNSPGGGPPLKVVSGRQAAATGV